MKILKVSDPLVFGFFMAKMVEDQRFCRVRGTLFSPREVLKP